MVRFKTDDTINWKGFSAVYQSASADAEPVTIGQTGVYTHHTLPYVHKPKSHKKLDKSYQQT